jgi:YD repeat-containing protein
MGSSLILQGGAAVAKTLKESIAQTGHGFTVGSVIRWDGTAATPKYVLALADTATNAEVAGVVNQVDDTDNFQVTYHGYIDIPSLSGISAPVMFLSSSAGGSLDASPPSAVGTVVKPVLTKNTNGSGYLVMNYLGTQIGGSSTIAVDEIQPVGTIMPFAGTVIPDTWLECDGGSYGITDYPELYEKLLYADGERAPLYGYVVELAMISTASAYYANLAVGNILLFKEGGSPTATSYDAAGLVVSKTAPSIANPGVHPVTVKILPKYDSGTKKFQFPNFVVTKTSGIVPFTDYTLTTRVTGSAANGHGSDFIAINKFLTPDLRGRFLLGMNPTEGDTTFISSTDFYSMASIGGEELHTLTTGEMPAHNHSASTNSTGAHTHTAQSAGAHTHTAQSAGAHRHKLFSTTTLNNDAAARVTAEGFAAVTLQESGAPLNYDIKNTTVNASLGQSSAEGDHTHTTDSQGNHTHATDSQGNHSHTVTVGNNGSNTAHNNMPPYLAVRYIIKAKPYTRAAIIDGIDLPYNSLLVRDLRTRNVGGSNGDLVFYTNTSGDAGNGTARMVLDTDGALRIGTSAQTYNDNQRLVVRNDVYSGLSGQNGAIAEFMTSTGDGFAPRLRINSTDEGMVLQSTYTSTANSLSVVLGNTHIGKFALHNSGGGALGIGITSSQLLATAGRLSVRSPVDTTALYLITRQDSLNYGLRIYEDSNDPEWVRIRPLSSNWSVNSSSIGDVAGNGYQKGFAFSGDNDTAVMTVWTRTKGGKVGIFSGDTEPNARLRVGSGSYEALNDYCANFTSDSNEGGLGGIVFSQNSTNGFKMWTQGTGNSTPSNNYLRISLIKISDGAYLGGRTETSPHFELSGAGTLKLNGTVVSTSDARVKTDIVTVDGALEKVLNMNGVYYRRTDTQSDKRCVGVIAQNVREHLPEVVEESNDGMLSVSYGNMVGVLLEAIKELHSKVESQSKEISELRNRIQ